MLIKGFLAGGGVGPRYSMEFVGHTSDQNAYEVGHDIYCTVDGMHNGYDLLSSSKDLRKHWLMRIAAGGIDLVIVAAPISAALFVGGKTDQWMLAGLMSGLGYYLYCTLLEGLFGQTWGKKLFGLRVVSLSSKRHSIVQAAIRSIPKFFWYAFLPFDVLAGLAVTVGDPRQRWSDKVALTTVVARPIPKKSRRLHKQEGTAPESTTGH